MVHVQIDTLSSFLDWKVDPLLTGGEQASRTETITNR